MSTQKQLEQWPIVNTEQDDYVEIWIEKFLVDRKIEGFTQGTLYFYQKKLALFAQYCRGQAVTGLRQVDADIIRGLLLWLESTGHNEGGRHCVYRAAKTFVRWWANEVEPENWSDPFKKVKAPKLAIEPLQPVAIETVKVMVDTCSTGDRIGARDKAILLFLIDTGVRASELLSIGRGDIDLVFGGILIRQGKGRKPRSVFIGKATKKALRAYLKMRSDSALSLWITESGDQLTYWGLRDVIARRAGLAGVPAPKLHDFRRAFALGMLRAGVDVYTLQRLMGHADLQVLRRYLAQNETDLAEAHRRASLGDEI